MEVGGLGIETCVFVGKAETSGLNLSVIPPNITILEVHARPCQDSSLWSSLGFASEAQFNSVQNQVDLIVTFPADNMLTADGSDQIAAIMEHTGGMEVIVMLGAPGHVDILASLQSLPIVSWLKACVLIWRRLLGGVAISHGKGIGGSNAAREVSELMTAAGIGVVVSGIECLAGPGPVRLPNGVGTFRVRGGPRRGIG
jgi:hypothetical protein